MKQKLIDKCKSEKPEILETISKTGKLDEETENALIELIKQHKESSK